VIYRVLLLAALVLSGCSTPVVRQVPENPAAAWQQRQLSLANVGDWQLRARIALQAGESGGQADLLWNTSKAANDLRLVGAWGRGLVRLQFDRQGATLIDDTGVRHEGNDAADLLYQVTGWIIPVSSLRAWMIGVPVDSGSATLAQLDDYGRLKILEENGWRIEYGEYSDYDGRELPKRLVLSQTRTLNGDAQITVRLVVTAWQVKQA